MGAGLLEEHNKLKTERNLKGESKALMRPLEIWASLNMRDLEISSRRHL